jgi:hypothetical protein
MHKPLNSLEMVPVTKGIIPQGIRFCRERLYVGNYVPGVLYMYDFTEKNFIRFSKCAIPGYLRRFVQVDDDFFICTGPFVLRISSNGEEIFTADLRRLVGNDRVVSCAIAAIGKQNKRILFIIDNFNGSIHKFYI